MAIESSKTWNAVADNTLLTSAPGETGGAFARHGTSEDTVPPRIFSGAVVPQQNSGNGQAYYDTTTLSSRNYEVTWTGYTGDATSDYLSLHVRSSSSAIGYEFFWLRSTNNLTLAKAGSALSTISGGGSGLADNNIEAHLKVDGEATTNIRVWIRRVSDGFYWNPGVGFQSGAVDCFNHNDSSSPITSIGVAGWGQRLQTAAPMTVTAWSIDVVSGDTTPPTITGPGGATGSTSSISVAENTTAVFTFTANEAVTWDLNGGADVALFTINSSTGALTFNSAPDFESPTDADTNNTYVVGVRATDGASNATTQTCTVTVTDVAIPTAPTIGTTTSIGLTTATINWTDNSSNETGFDVEIETPSGANNWTAASTSGSNPTAANATSLAITGLSNGTQYRPRVRARGAEGNSAWSTGSAFTTVAPGVLTISNIFAKVTGTGTAVGQAGQAGTYKVFSDDLANLVATKTGTIDVGNDIALSDVLFVAGTWYRIFFLLANGKQGSARVQAT